MANRTRAAPMASVYESHPDGGFGPGYSGEYVTAPTPPNHTTAKYGSFMQRSAMHHNPPPSYTGVHNPPAPASTYAPSIFSAPLAKDATPRDQGKSGASTKSEAERSGGWCAGWYWERPGWKLDKGVLNMDKWAPDTYGRTRGFLILLASVLAVVCAILLIILLGRKHDGRPSGGVNTPRYKVNEGNVIDNWVVFQGDWFMQNTFLSVAAEILDERATLHGLVRGNWSEEAPRALPPYRDYLLVCYQDDACLLQGFACTHFQAPCEVGKEGTTVNEDRCQPHGTNVVGADYTVMCPFDMWVQMLDAIQDPTVEFAISFHWVSRAMARQQPGMSNPNMLQSEPKFHDLHLLDADKKLALAVPGYVHLNGCHDSFLPSRSFEWDAASHTQLLEMFVAMEVYNMIIYRQAGYQRPFAYQSCTPLDCSVATAGVAGGNPGTPLDSSDCMGMNFQLRQVNKRLLKMVREEKPSVGEVRWVDAFVLTSLSPDTPCDGTHPFCTHVYTAAWAAAATPAADAVSPSAMAGRNTTVVNLSQGGNPVSPPPSTVARAIGKLTAEALNPPFLQAEPLLTPCLPEDLEASLGITLNNDGTIPNRLYN